MRSPNRKLVNSILGKSVRKGGVGSEDESISLHSLLLVSLALSLLAPNVHSQIKGEKDVDDKVLRASEMFLEEVIITGRAGSSEQTKFEASNSITTMNVDHIRERAPLGVADLLTEIPGFYAENTAGVGGNNVFVRGLPQGGGYRFTSLQVDGLPLFHDGQLSFMESDDAIRIDETIERVEAIRGGSSPIFAGGAQGGIVNMITRKGTEVFEGLYKFTTSDYGTFRHDLNLSGPLNDSWLFSLGGFWRTDDGVRDPDYTANKGHQVRASLTRVLDNGNITVSGWEVDDRNIVYLPIPLQNSDDPEDLGGFDALYDTINSNSISKVVLRTPEGDVESDLTDGSHLQQSAIGMEIELELADGVFLSNKFRYVDTDFSRNGNGLFPDNNGFPDQETFLDTYRNRLADTSDSSLDYFRENGVTDFGFSYVSSSDAVTAPYVAELFWGQVSTPFESYTNDFQLSKAFDFGDFGVHDLTVGYYHTSFDRALVRNIGNRLLADIDSGSALALEIDGLDDSGAVATDANGNELTITDNGFLSYSSSRKNADQEGNVDALYIVNEWSVTEDFRLDLGVRHEKTELRGANEITPKFDLGDPTTLADDRVDWGNGQFATYNVDFSETFWTVGFNYQLSDEVVFYGRYVDSSHIPRFSEADNLTGSNQTADDLGEVEDITQMEAGIRLRGDDFAMYATVFRTEFTPNTITGTDIGTGAEISIDVDTETIGIEVEGVWGPLPRLDVAFNVTYQEPEYQGGGIEEDGNQLIRIPELMVSLTPSYDIFDDLYVFMNIKHIGERFTDIANNQALPSYTTVAGGVIYQLNDSVTLQLKGENLLNEVGLSEGNTRTLADLQSGTESDKYYGRPIFGRNFQASLLYEF